MSDIILPIILSHNNNNSEPLPDCCVYLICSPCIIIAAPFLLIKKLYDCCTTRKEKNATQKIIKKEKNIYITSSTPELKELLIPNLKQNDKLIKKREIINTCRSHIGLPMWELLERGSHNNAVIKHLQNQPKWILRHIFEDLETYWQCGKERMLFLKSQIGYTSMINETCKIIGA